MNNIMDGDGNLETRLKIIRNESTGTSVYGNYWEISTIKEYLISTYFPTVSVQAKSLMKSALWNLGIVPASSSKPNTTPKESYVQERSENVPTGRDKTWFGNVSLMYVSDYGFAVGGANTVRTNCLNRTIGTWYKDACRAKAFTIWSMDAY